MKQHLIAISTLCTVILAGASAALAQEEECAYAALQACTASFTSVPTYVESGTGTCVYQGDEPALNGGPPPRLSPPTDVLQVTVAPLPVCEDCEVVVTAVWNFYDPLAQDVSEAKTTPWPHEVWLFAKAAPVGEVITWSLELQCEGCEPVTVNAVATTPVVETAPVIITIIPGDGDDPPIVDTKSKTVDDGDTVHWVVPNNLAHQCDASPNVATTLRLRFIGANPTTGPAVTTSPIPAAGGGDVDHLVTLNDPLDPGTYTYVLEILDQYGNVLCEIDPELVHEGPTPAPGLLQEGVVALVALLLVLGAVLVSRRGPLRTG